MRIINTLLVLFVLIAGCTTNPSWDTEKSLKALYGAVLKGDMETVIKYIPETERAQIDLEKLKEKWNVEDSGITLGNMEIVSEDENGDKNHVKYKITFKDGDIEKEFTKEIELKKENQKWILSSQLELLKLF